ncbi:DUF4357 domain-containing protein [Micromonospora chalcea]|uniref:DUF4357 domain-containing protein n=1 Tax=Micromonospora chalcea TaxID=1874 RepID=UPI0004C3B202|nr:DUF4357 domain-containing protein [Micromonospora purpureochromogenes]
MRLTINLDAVALMAALDSGVEELELTLAIGSPAADAGATSGVIPVARGPLAPLLNAGLLKAGERLHFSQPRARRAAVAMVQSDGSLKMEGRSAPYWSPSKAAVVVTGSSVNGWTLWRTDDGRTLDDLRNLLDEELDRDAPER